MHVSEDWVLVVFIALWILLFLQWSNVKKFRYYSSVIKKVYLLFRYYTCLLGALEKQGVDVKAVVDEVGGKFGEDNLKDALNCVRREIDKET